MTSKNKTIYHITIPGRPVPKKNHPIFIHNKNILLPSKAWRQYESNAIGSKKNPGPLQPFLNLNISHPISLKCLYFLPNKRWWPDLVGLLQGTSDLLQKANIISNDSLIINYNGSKIAGIDLLNPRTDITIYILPNHHLLHQTT